MKSFVDGVGGSDRGHPIERRGGSERRKLDIRKIGTKRLYFSLVNTNDSLFLVFVILALLAQFEVLQLSQLGQQTSLSVNLYCSNLSFWPQAMLHRSFVVAQDQNYEVRDSTLNGICARGTLSFVGVAYQQLQPNASADCEWTMIDTRCDYDPSVLRQVVSQGFQAARRSGIGLETAVCHNRSTHALEEITTVLCSDYHVNQQVCIDAAVERVKVSHIIGIIGLILYPIFFWTRVFSFFSFSMPIAWGASMSYYYVRTDFCMFFILEKIAVYVLFFGVGWMAIQIFVLFAALLKGNSWQEIEAYLKAKNGIVGDEEAIQQWRGDLRSSLSSSEEGAPLRRSVSQIDSYE